MGTTRATKLLITTAVLLVAVAAAQAPVAAPGSETSTGTGAPGPSTTVAGGPGPSAGEDCLTNLYNMSDCLTYVEEGSNLTAPDKACCPELAGLVESHPICLCQLLGTNTSSFGIQINLQKALKLPSVCAVETPPISTCSAVGYPVGVPMPSEAPSPPAVGYPVGVPMPSEAPSPPVGYPVGVPMPSEAPSPPGGTSPEASTPKSGASGIANVSQLLGFAIVCLTTALVF